MNILKVLKTVLKFCAYVAVFAEFVQFAITKVEPFFDNTETIDHEELSKQS